MIAKKILVIIFLMFLGESIIFAHQAVSDQHSTHIEKAIHESHAISKDQIKNQAQEEQPQPEGHAENNLDLSVHFTPFSQSSNVSNHYSQISKWIFRKMTQDLDNPKALLPQIGDFLGVSGLINIDTRYQSQPEFMNKKVTKISLADTALNVDAKAGEWLQGHVGLFYASRPHYYYPKVSNDRAIDLDEAYVTLVNLDKSPFYIRIGRQYLPFGEYNRHPILKSLTQQLSETRSLAALQLGAIFQKGFYGVLYIGDRSERPDFLENHHRDSSNTYGTALGYTYATEKTRYDVSVDYLDNMAEVGSVNQNLVTNHDEKKVGALAINGSIEAKPFDVVVHYVTALQSFARQDFGFQKQLNHVTGARPKALGVSSGYFFKVKGKNSKAQIGYEHSYQAYNINVSVDALRLPKYRCYAIYGIEPWHHVILALEGARDRDYPKRNGGTNKFNNTFDARITYLFE